MNGFQAPIIIYSNKNVGDGRLFEVDDVDDDDDERDVVCNRTKSNNTRLISLRKTTQIDSKSADRKILLKWAPNIVVSVFCNNLE